MGCTESKFPDAPIGYDPISDTEQKCFAKLGLSKPDITALYLYFHRLKLDDNGLLDLELYLRSIKITPCHLTIRIFDNRVSLSGQHAKVDFVQVRTYFLSYISHIAN